MYVHMHVLIRMQIYVNTSANPLVCENCLNYQTMIQFRRLKKCCSTWPWAHSAATYQTSRCSRSRASQDRFAQWRRDHCRPYQVGHRSPSSWQHAQE